MGLVVRVEKTSHRGQQRLKLIFDRAEEVILQLRKLSDARWSATMRCWHILYYENHLEFLNSKFKGNIRFVPMRQECGDEAPGPQEEKKAGRAQVPQTFIEQMKIGRFSENTIKAYSSTIVRFLEFNREKSPEAREPEQVRKYLLHLVEIRLFQPAIRIRL